MKTNGKISYWRFDLTEIFWSWSRFIAFFHTLEIATALLLWFYTIKSEWEKSALFSVNPTFSNFFCQIELKQHFFFIFVNQSFTMCVKTRNSLSLKKYFVKSTLVISLSKLGFTKFLRKKVGEEFPNFHTVIHESWYFCQLVYFKHFFSRNYQSLNLR